MAWLWGLGSQLPASITHTCASCFVQMRDSTSTYVAFALLFNTCVVCSCSSICVPRGAPGKTPSHRMARGPWEVQAGSMGLHPTRGEEGLGFSGCSRWSVLADPGCLSGLGWEGKARLRNGVRPQPQSRLFSQPFLLDVCVWAPPQPSPHGLASVRGVPLPSLLHSQGGALRTAGLHCSACHPAGGRSLLTYSAPGVGALLTPFPVLSRL